MTKIIKLQNDLLKELNKEFEINQNKSIYDAIVDVEASIRAVTIAKEK